MNRFRTVAFLALCVLVVGCWSTKHIKGSGNVVSENRPVTDFDSIALNGSGQLEVDQSGSESLTITADDNLLQLLTSEVKGHQLVLAVKSGYSLGPSKPIVFKVSAKNLKGVAFAGDTTANLKGIHTDELKLSVAGSGDISAEGMTDRQEISIEGSGKYLGGGLKSKEAKINILGSGEAVMTVSESLEVSIAGSGEIKYYGDPKVKQNIVGSGSVTKE